MSLFKDNRINYLPENVFVPLVNLSDLLLHDNRLEFVWPRTFFGLKSLRRLTLAGNRLTSLPEAALRHSPALRYLDLADNNFRSLQRCAFPVSTAALRTLSVIGNLHNTLFIVGASLKDLLLLHSVICSFGRSKTVIISSQLL